ncbi:helix-turn-helix transcriptional regulator [Homoserinibacter sp. YIM 151385]|uniref:helix-turn-helix transcriptional regulator n=1 Tax=Homoserinibacter sp. YIM 151385 TaxID=2985506 RepID=UPI0022EFEBB4|nr:helix-turn-helix transcriptional regulator [Homoserinibacter sp. YIM 151385]WBU38268.1 helix-turn-helix domain-containing protein [Homoserinibacter sp. YIM 151385]
MKDLVTLGQRMRHFRGEAGLTLEQLGQLVGVAGSQLSLMENGRREPRLSVLTAIAEQLGVPLAELLEERPPSPRAALEIELERAQRGTAYAELGLPVIRAGRTMGDDTLEAIVGLHRELARRAREAIATPEEARRVNTELRQRMRTEDNALPWIDELAEAQLAAVGHSTGALTHRSVSRMAERLGFELVHVPDLPHSARSVTDLENGRIYLPPASIPGGHGLRSMALQAIAHRLLEHEAPVDYADFLRQRLEINYFAAACLMPRAQSVEFLRRAKADRDIAVEDFRDAFGVTHEAAALRFTNLATEHLDMRVHFLRVGDDGAVSKAYENDGLRLPVDVTGSAEGQIVCRQWAARRAFARTNRTTEFYQYTDTPEGTFFESTQIGTGDGEEFSITIGVPFAESKWFRGRETGRREHSRCPDASCCRRPSAELRERWAGRAWSSAKVHAHIFSPLPSGTFPGVDDRELYEFLETHAGS